MSGIIGQVGLKSGVIGQNDIVNVSSSFSLSSGNTSTQSNFRAIKQNNLVYIMFYASLESVTSGHQDLYQCNDSSLYPERDYYLGGPISYQGDYLGYISFETSGKIIAKDVTSGSTLTGGSSDSTHRIFANFWYATSI